MSGDKKQNVSVDDIRRAVMWEMTSPFTITEVVEKLKLLHPDKEEVDAMLVNAYLSQIERAGIVEQARGSRKWHINTLSEVCPHCGK